MNQQLDEMDIVHSDEPLHLSQDESKVLDLYEKLEKLRLESAIVRAQNKYIPKTDALPSAEQLKRAQERLLSSRAQCSLQKEVVDNVLSMYPILKSVHRGVFSSPIERDMAPYLQDRDSVSMEISNQSARIRELLDQTTTVQGEALKATRSNAQLASEVLDLAAQVSRQKEEPLKDIQVDAELQKLQEELKLSRQKWLVMKGTASAIVSGSGVDWARDPELLEVVLDPEDDI